MLTCGVFSGGVLVVLALSGLAGWPAAAERRARGEEKNGFEHVHALAMGVDGRTLWLGAHGRLFRSADGGQTWQRLTVSAMHRQRDVMSVVADPVVAHTIYVGTHEAGVFRTEDGAPRGTW